jgi:hypothetical protein
MRPPKVLEDLDRELQDFIEEDDKIARLANLQRDLRKTSMRKKLSSYNVITNAELFAEHLATKYEAERRDSLTPEPDLKQMITEGAQKEFARLKELERKQAEEVIAAAEQVARETYLLAVAEREEAEAKVKVADEEKKAALKEVTAKEDAIALLKLNNRARLVLTVVPLTITSVVSIIVAILAFAGRR